MGSIGSIGPITSIPPIAALPSLSTSSSSSTTSLSTTSLSASSSASSSSSSLFEETKFEKNCQISKVNDEMIMRQKMLSSLPDFKLNKQFKNINIMEDINIIKDINMIKNVNIIKDLTKIPLNCGDDIKDCKKGVSKVVNNNVTSGNKGNWKCKICNKSFLHECNLKIHSIIHTDKALHCQFCNKPFARSSNLDQHLRVHTDYRPWKCPNCSKSFRQKHRYCYY